MILGDGKLPPFIGYSPPVIDGTLLELVNMSYPDYPPRRGRNGAQLAEERRLAIDGLQIVFEQRPHERAMAILAEAMRECKPYCLYLRNFDLGARTYHSNVAPYGIPQMATLASAGFNAELESEIQIYLSPKLPVFCIRNPADAFGTLPAFIVSDQEWQEFAQTLVRNAGLVILYFVSLTPGVELELTILRQENKQQSTLVVTENDDPFHDEIGLANCAGVDRKLASFVPADLPDFPHHVSHDSERGWGEMKHKLDELLQRELHGPIEKRIGVPVEYIPPEPLRKFCTDHATEEFDAAQKLMAEQRNEEAEDALMRSIAFAHWGRDDLGRAMTLATLGGLNLHAFNAKGEAGAYFAMALEICERIRDSSPTAAALYPHLHDQLERLRRSAENRSVASHDS
jgi:hypothetical protein